MTTDTNSAIINAEVEDYSPETTAITTVGDDTDFLTYGSGGNQTLNLVRIVKPKSVEATHPEVVNCCYWRYPSDERPLYRPFRKRNGQPQNTLANLQLVAIEETIVSYSDSPDAAKLNLSVVDDTDPTADVLTITGGLGSNWSISVLQGLVTMVNNHPAMTPFNLSTAAKSTPRGQTHYAYIYVGNEWLKNDELFDRFQTLKTEAYDVGASPSSYKPLLSLCRELVAQISAALPDQA